jgi:hypothetical protein
MNGSRFAAGDRVWARARLQRLLGRRGQPGRIVLSAGVGEFSGAQLWYVRLDGCPDELGVFFENELTPELERIQPQLQPAG